MILLRFFRVDGMNQKIIKIGIVGAGQNTKQMHTPRLLAIDGVEIVSVCNRSRQSSQAVADQFNIPVVYDDWQALVKADDTNAIVIGTWPYMHCEVTLASLKADKHVLCEARMACDYDQARQMYQASKERPNLTAQIVPSPMTLEYDVTIKKLIDEGFLGDLLAVDLAGESDFIDRDALMRWRYDFKLSGFNTMSLGIWYEAIMRWIGPAKKVNAMARIFVTKRRDESGNLHQINVPDYLDVIVEMACGAQLHIQLSSVSGLSSGQKLFLYGSRGTLCLDNNTLLGGSKDDKQLKKIPVDPALKGSWRVEEEFINAIKGKEKVKLTTFETGLKYMKFTEAVINSSQTGKTIQL